MFQVRNSTQPPHCRKNLRAANALAASLALALVSGACTGEDAEPVDFSSTSTSVASDTPSDFDVSNVEDGPNAEQNQITLGFAEQQCLDDPELEQGYVQIVDPSTNEKVSEVTVECDEVRSREN